ncbi:MAG: class A beta-lactamase-related serine hydrolase [Acidimicrobiales bacterium]|nr:beta-lactamase family protein [Hyphomonadaceae bacterium]RZV36344.1 MAG: class A beta-lactamase-related serine hydrolase [Acidimicrobiales bacterium]
MVFGVLSLSLTACTNADTSKNSKLTSVEASSFDTINIDAVLSDMVENGEVVGASGLVYHSGQEVYFGAYGLADREAEREMSRASLANIYSMTKPVTGVTLMSLYEEGLFELDDPLAEYLPEYSNMKVFAGIDDNGDIVLESPNRPITILDIMRHTAGFGYDWGEGPVADAQRQAGLLDPGKPLAQFSEELAALPLYFQPGTQWKYGVAVDVQARLAEKIAGIPYERLVQDRVVKPLGMNDTGYFVPADQKDRLTAVYIRGEDGTLSREADTQVYGFWTEKPKQINGGHGLVSSLDDYMRFARMLLNKGTLDGVQILKPETIELMTSDHLPSGLSELDFLPGKGQVGFGLDFAVRTAPPVDDLENPGEVGEFFWDGRASTLFWVDPKNDLTAVFFVQVVPFDGTLHNRFRRAVYAALDRGK